MNPSKELSLIADTVEACRDEDNHVCISAEEITDLAFALRSIARQVAELEAKCPSPVTVAQLVESDNVVRFPATQPKTRPPAATVA